MNNYDVRYVVREHKVKKIEGILGERTYTESILKNHMETNFIRAYKLLYLYEMNLNGVTL